MPKTKIPETRKKKLDQAIGEGTTTADYQRYLREHERKLKRLQRELSGDNMNRPPEDDYE